MADWLHFINGMRLSLYQAGRIAVRLQGQVRTEQKEKDASIQTSTEVSAADRLCQEVLLLAAHDLDPRLSAYSEEWEACPPAIRQLFPEDGRHVVVLDPIDGTVDYLDGLESYGTMLGILERDTGRMQAGALYFPATGRLMAGVQGLGPWTSEGYWGAPRLVLPVTPPRVIAATKRMHPSDAERLAQAGWHMDRDVSRSCAWELARVVRGEVGGMVMRGFHGHDSAVGVLLLELLGGAALDEQGEPVRYKAEMPRMPLVVLAHRAEDARTIWEAIDDLV